MSRDAPPGAVPGGSASPAVAAPGRALVSAAIGAALMPLNSTMVAVALPALSLHFDAPAATVTLLVVTGYLVATLVCQMPAGSVADRVGYARALAWGRWMFAVGAVAGTVAPTLGVVLAGRLLMAAGGALIVPTAMALLRVTVPPERRSRAFGTLGGIMGGAAALGPALGGWMVAQFGWRSLFLVNLPLIAASWLLQPRVTGGAPRSAAVAHPFDWPGSLLIAGALLLLMLATRMALPGAFWVAAAGALVFGVLLAHERRTAAPVLNLALFRERGFVAGALVIALQNMAMYSLIIQVPFLFGTGGGVPDSRLGLAIVAMTATMAITSPLGGWLVERAGVRAVVGTGGLIATGGVAALALLPSSAAAGDIALRLLVVGLGLGLSTAPANAAALTAAPVQHSAVAGATVSMLRYLGAIAGTVILSIVFTGSGAAASGQHALWAFAGALLVSGALALVLPPLPAARTYRS